MILYSLKNAQDAGIELLRTVGVNGFPSRGRLFNVADVAGKDCNTMLRAVALPFAVHASLMEASLINFEPETY